MAADPTPKRVAEAKSKVAEVFAQLQARDAQLVRQVQTDAQRQAAWRARQLAAGMTEVRGIYLLPEQHGQLRSQARKLRGKP